MDKSRGALAETRGNEASLFWILTIAAIVFLMILSMGLRTRVALVMTEALDQVVVFALEADSTAPFVYIKGAVIVIDTVDKAVDTAAVVRVIVKVTVAVHVSR
jgi:hypothetical protein